jgi:hypothetical protein
MDVLEYLGDQLHGEEITHLERVMLEHVGGIRYEIWDAHTGSGERWWVVTNPTNLYTQQDFKSKDVVLTFHIGLAMRVANRYSVPITPSAEEILSGPWRR